MNLKKAIAAARRRATIAKILCLPSFNREELCKWSRCSSTLANWLSLVHFGMFILLLLTQT